MAGSLVTCFGPDFVFDIYYTHHTLVNIEVDNISIRTIFCGEHYIYE